MPDDPLHLKPKAQLVRDRGVLEALAVSSFILGVYDHWNGLRRGRCMPSRADLDPVELPRALLPSVFMVDVTRDPLDFRYRLLGTALVEWFGHDPTGRRVVDGTAFENVDVALSNYRMVEQHRLPIVVPQLQLAHAVHGDHMPKCMLMLPLTRSCDQVDIVFGCVEPGFTEGLAELRRRRFLDRLQSPAASA